MTTLRQIASNQRNALKSTGPTTPEGKQRSRCNAVRHGLTAETVIGALEDADDYQAFEAAVIADYDAETAVQRELALRLASALWRLRRATGIEAALFESMIEIPGTTEFDSDHAEPLLLGAAGHAAGQTSPEVPQRSDAANEPALDAKRSVGDTFLRLAALPICPLDRLSRYEHLLWRQARQIILTLEALRHRKRPPNRPRFPFPFRANEG